MGQGISYGTQYKYQPGTFKADFDSAISYNNTNYSTKVGTTATDYAAALGVPAMLENENTDDLITYIMILQAVPMDKILNPQLTGYNFTNANQTINGNSKTVDVQNVTGSSSDLADNKWRLTDSGRIEAKLPDDVSDGKAVFKCLMEWFNKLDDIQNNYINAIASGNVSQAMIQSLVLQAESVQRQYQELYNKISKLRVAGDEFTIYGKSKDQIIAAMINSGKNQRRVINLTIDKNGEITEAKFNNGTSLTVNAPSQSPTQTDLSYYSYDINEQNAYTKAQALYNQFKDNKKDIWQFTYDAKPCVIVYSVTNLNPTAHYHILPLPAFMKYLYDHKPSEGYRSINTSIKHDDKKVENYNAKLSQAMNKAQQEKSDVNQLLNSPRMQQFKKNVEAGNIKLEGYTSVYK